MDTLVTFGGKPILDNNHFIPLDVADKESILTSMMQNDKAHKVANTMMLMLFKDQNNGLVVLLVHQPTLKSDAQEVSAIVFSSDPELHVHYSSGEEVTRRAKELDDTASMPWQWESQWSTSDSSSNQYSLMIGPITPLSPQAEDQANFEDVKVCLKVLHLSSGIQSLQLLHRGETPVVDLASCQKDILSNLVCFTNFGITM